MSNGDDPQTLTNDAISTNWLDAVTLAYQDAAIQGVTVCIASGDYGTNSRVGDGKAHVQYPASDPWVLSVGGTTIGDVNGKLFDEYVWNDFFVSPSGTSIQTGTGGGVPPPSDFSHPAFQGSKIRTIKESQLVACKNASDIACVHGTFVAGILCSKRGLDAPAICPGCEIILNPIFQQDTDDGKISSDNITPSNKSIKCHNRNN
jgi:hypothetical protein